MDIIERLKMAANVDYGALLDAMEEIKRLRDRETKYEKALLSMSKYVQVCHRCIHDENSAKCSRQNGCDDSICYRGHVDYYKKQASLEVLP